MKRLTWIVATLILISIASAGPGPWGIAINQESEVCAPFWPGDEFTNYELPDGWTFYFPGVYQPITTPYRDCVVDVRDSPDALIENFARCCAKLGKEYVDNPTIITEDSYYKNNDKPMHKILFTKNNNYYSCYPGVKYGVAIKENTCKITYQHTESERKHLYLYYKDEDSANKLLFKEDEEITYDQSICNDELDEESEAYYVEETDYPTLVTHFGTCNFTRYDEEACCAELGLTFSKNIPGKTKSTTAHGLKTKLFSSLPIIIILIIIVIVLVIIAKRMDKEK